MATDENKCSGIKILDPVQGLVDYVLDVKPFHTKVVEVLIEYVYGENIITRIGDTLYLQLDLVRPSQPLNVVCDQGYSTQPFGDPQLFPVISPNQAISLEDYPAIDSASRTMVVPGDHTKDVKIGSRVLVTSWIEDYSDPYNIVITPGIHDGWYTVSSVRFIPKQTDTWPNFPDINFYQ